MNILGHLTFQGASIMGNPVESHNSAAVTPLVRPTPTTPVPPIPGQPAPAQSLAHGLVARATPITSSTAAGSSSSAAAAAIAAETLAASSSSSSSSTLETQTQMQAPRNAPLKTGRPGRKKTKRDGSMESTEAKMKFPPSDHVLSVARAVIKEDHTLANDIRGMQAKLNREFLKPCPEQEKNILIRLVRKGNNYKSKENQTFEIKKEDVAKWIKSGTFVVYFPLDFLNLAKSELPPLYTLRLPSPTPPDREPVALPLASSSSSAAAAATTPQDLRFSLPTAPQEPVFASGSSSSSAAAAQALAIPTPTPQTVATLTTSSAPASSSVAAAAAAAQALANPTTSYQQPGIPLAQLQRFPLPELPPSLQLNIVQVPSGFTLLSQSLMRTPLQVPVSLISSVAHPANPQQTATVSTSSSASSSSSAATVANPIPPMNTPSSSSRLNASAVAAAALAAQVSSTPAPRQQREGAPIPLGGSLPTAPIPHLQAPVISTSSSSAVAAAAAAAQALSASANPSLPSSSSSSDSFSSSSADSQTGRPLRDLLVEILHEEEYGKQTVLSLAAAQACLDKKLKGPCKDCQKNDQFLIKQKPTKKQKQNLEYLWVRREDISERLNTGFEVSVNRKDLTKARAALRKKEAQASTESSASAASPSSLLETPLNPLNRSSSSSRLNSSRDFVEGFLNDDYFTNG